ncbi:hypothetical protein LCGC14_0544210 [marine sediment metagenome]|uniref:DUF4326 domain-containing protein n=1 Tax=marine sediment metagenome TaxID=412755 RepID=A0A0F9RRT8_9ZZZZ
MKVVNITKDIYDVYIGRGSKWGNPFIIGKDGNREEVISKYEAYFMAHLSLIDDLPELEGKILGCFCKPQDCHGDILVRMVEDKIWKK